jgi:hypothetical protein
MVENGNPKMCNLKTGGFVDISLFVDSDLIICTGLGIVGRICCHAAII